MESNFREEAWLWNILALSLLPCTMLIHFGPEVMYRMLPWVICGSIEFLKRLLEPDLTAYVKPAVGMICQIRSRVILIAGFVRDSTCVNTVDESDDNVGLQHLFEMPSISWGPRCLMSCKCSCRGGPWTRELKRLSSGIVHFSWLSKRCVSKRRIPHLVQDKSSLKDQSKSQCALNDTRKSLGHFQRFDATQCGDKYVRLRICGQRFVCSFAF